MPRRPPRGLSAPRFADALGHGASDKRIQILRGVAASGSISQAARDASVSYKAAWQAIATLTNLAGVDLVARAVGGAGGGGATLTAAGVELLQMAGAHSQARLALRSPVAPSASAAVGAASAFAGLAVRTSMRNQLPATLLSLQRAGRVVRAQMQLFDQACIVARITHESVELLGLIEGMGVIALCKATAVRIESPDSRGATLRNALTGKVLRIERADDGEGASEVAIALGAGLELVGFASPDVALRKGRRVVAMVDEAAVVVALPA